MRKPPNKPSQRAVKPKKPSQRVVKSKIARLSKAWEKDKKRPYPQPDKCKGKRKPKACASGKLHGGNRKNII